MKKLIDAGEGHVEVLYNLGLLYLDWDKGEPTAEAITRLQTSAGIFEMYRQEEAQYCIKRGNYEEERQLVCDYINEATRRAYRYSKILNERRREKERPLPNYPPPDPTTPPERPEGK